jgi:hypothetical protein
MKSIYDVYVTVTSQEQADRLKGICLEYGLPIWDDKTAFEFDVNEDVNLFAFDNVNSPEFLVFTTELEGYTPITESEFLELAKEFKQ